MNKPVKPRRTSKHRLREVHEGNVLRLADMSFAVVSTELRRSTVHLDLEAADGSRTTLIGVPGARVSLRQGAGEHFRAHARPEPVSNQSVDTNSASQ
jgi:hypothetical protein